MRLIKYWPVSPRRDWHYTQRSTLKRSKQESFKINDLLRCSTDLVVLLKLTFFGLGLIINLQTTNLDALPNCFLVRLWVQCGEDILEMGCRFALQLARHQWFNMEPNFVCRHPKFRRNVTPQSLTQHHPSTLSLFHHTLGSVSTICQRFRWSFSMRFLLNIIMEVSKHAELASPRSSPTPQVSASTPASSVTGVFPLWKLTTRKLTLSQESDRTRVVGSWWTDSRYVRHQLHLLKQIWRTSLLFSLWSSGAEFWRQLHPTFSGFSAT